MTLNYLNCSLLVTSHTQSHSEQFCFSNVSAKENGKIRVHKFILQINIKKNFFALYTERNFRYFIAKFYRVYSDVKVEQFDNINIIINNDKNV